MIAFIALGLHILAGFVALALGGIILALQKGDHRHKLVGKIFYYAMLTVCFSAVYIAIEKNNYFLLHIGIFSFYLNYSGKRAIENKLLIPNLLDKIVIALAIVNGIIMFVHLNIVLIFFGVINLLLLFREGQLLLQLSDRKKLDKTKWLTRHIVMMVATYIATFTAFVVVNITNFPIAWLPWVLPSIIGTPLIFYFKNKYTKSKKT